MWKFWKRKKPQYDNVRVVNLHDGTTVEGHEGVEAYFEQELFRLDLQATTFDEFQSGKLAEHRVDGDWISGEDTVAMVKDKIRPLVSGKAKAGERITFYFANKPMDDDALFYADHFMMLPVWVQVLLHDSTAEDIEAAIHRLRSSAVT
ncbi:MAG: hypothetical protein E6J91_12030 [Deltaproteobacteria bacterium]|nr:MAG: hypothetical protein E6J91_12030 [Deltaproteobacteria bacterium]